MDKPFLLYQHDKNNWTVKLMSDGNLWIIGTFKRRQSSVSNLDIRSTYLSDLNVPGYVKRMVFEIKQEWRDYNAR